MPCLSVNIRAKGRENSRRRQTGAPVTWPYLPQLCPGALRSNNLSLPSAGRAAAAPGTGRAAVVPGAGRAAAAVPGTGCAAAVPGTGCTAATAPGTGRTGSCNIFCIIKYEHLTYGCHVSFFCGFHCFSCFLPRGHPFCVTRVYICIYAVQKGMAGMKKNPNPASFASLNRESGIKGKTQTEREIIR